MRCAFLLALMMLSQSATADCGVTNQACVAVCEVKYMTDDTAELGCKSRCAAERAACVAKEGAEQAGEAAEETLGKAKSFFSGLNGD